VLCSENWFVTLTTQGREAAEGREMKMGTGIVAGVIIIFFCSWFTIQFTKEEGLKGKNAAIAQAFGISWACGLWWTIFVYLYNPPLFLLKYHSLLTWILVWMVAQVFIVTFCLTYPLYLIFRPKPTG
jgi:hypothetical protein